MSLSENQAPEIRLSFADGAVLKQRRQMLIALTLLLVALVMILTKDRDFWFPSAPGFQSTSEPMEEPSSEPPAQSEAVTSPKQTSSTTMLKAKQPKPVISAGSGQAPAAAPVVVNRTVLPPLEVEVVAGDQHRTAPAFDFQSGSPNPAGIGYGHAGGSCHSSPSFPQRNTDPFTPGRT
jgi:hypothetical protein